MRSNMTDMGRSVFTVLWKRVYYSIGVLVTSSIPPLPYLAVKVGFLTTDRTCVDEAVVWEK